MRIEDCEVYGFRKAILGMRNPYSSWDKSDSQFNSAAISQNIQGTGYREWQDGPISVPEHPIIGPNDLALACKLIKGGSEHRKFLRQIQIWVNFTLPRYVWTELDTYKVATIRNSCSTMHKLGSKNLDQDNFEDGIHPAQLEQLNIAGAEYRRTKSVEVLRRLKNDLPEGFLQKATYMMSYETAMSMYFQRRNHRLIEWNEDNPASICNFIKCLPYIKEFINAKE